MPEKNVSDPPTVVPKTTKPASEALLNEKVCCGLCVSELEAARWASSEWVINLSEGLHRTARDTCTLTDNAG